jgi:hypothetical protein
VLEKSRALVGDVHMAVTLFTLSGVRPPARLRYRVAMIVNTSSLSMILGRMYAGSRKSFDMRYCVSKNPKRQNTEQVQATLAGSFCPKQRTQELPEE